MFRNRILILFLFSILSSISESAPQLTFFKGKILEKGTRRPLSEVNLFILPQKWKVTTNAQGEFQSPDVPTLENELIVNFTGYKKWTQKVDVA